MSSDLTGFYIVLKCSKPEKITRFSRIRKMLSTFVLRLFFSLRKKVSKIVINGRPLVAEPTELPPELRYLSCKQLQRLKKALGEIEQKGPEIRHFCRPGFFAPPSTPVSEMDDLAVEVIHAEEEFYEVDKGIPSHFMSAEAHNSQLRCNGSINENTKRKKYIRPKAAKGERSDTVIPPYIIIDEDAAFPGKGCKRKRPTAAKGKRSIDIINPIDLPAEVLVERLKNIGAVEERPISTKTRCRPQAARGERSSGMVQFNSHPADTEPSIIHKNRSSPHANDIDLPNKPESLDRKLLPGHSIDEQIASESDGDNEDGDDIFNVVMPYLPKSQRKFSKLTANIPWLK